MSEAPNNHEQHPDPALLNALEQLNQEYDGARIPLIDNFLLTPEGRERMEALIAQIDGYDTVDIAEFVEKVHDPSSYRPNKTLNLLLSAVGREGLQRESLIEAYLQNPAMNLAQQHMQHARHSGYKESEALYSKVLTLLANITRYEVLYDTYDPDSEAWQDRAGKVSSYQLRGKVTQYHPTRTIRAKH